MWSPSRRSNSRRIEGGACQLVAECESFLLGRYPWALQARGCPVPEWAWLSALTHTPASSFMTRADRERAGSCPDHMTVLWQGAFDLLAQELMTTAERSGSSIEALQRALIAEVELKRPWAESGAPVLGPSRLVRDVRQVLSRFRGSSQPR
jgi:hypothetical protein